VPVIRVLVVDDSDVACEVLREMLEAERDIEVVGVASTGEQAVRQVLSLRPDVTTMDVQMPGLGGLEAIEQIMARSPVPILVVTARPTGPHDEVAFEAVRRGALDLVEKPVRTDLRAGQRLRALVRSFATVPVVRHMAGTRPKRVQTHAASSPLPPASSPDRPYRVLGIGASAGGPAAIVAILSQLPRELDAAVTIAQHLPDGFAPTFAGYLQDRTTLSVRLVESGAVIERGIVYVPRSGCHIVLSGPRTVAATRATDPGVCPSVTSLFDSLATALGPAAVGVVLSGMGCDGADGMRRMAAAGAATIAQDEATSAVYGMPKAAAATGGARQILPLAKIAPALVVLSTRRPPDDGSGR
jgi:two-component system, chemotaxis family, protein-glutamate methylesterase/glutaminase